MKRENTRCRLYVRDTRLAWIRGKELFQPRVDFKSILCLFIRMERLISIRRLSILWFLQISSDFAYSRLHDSCKLAYDASFYKWYNALKIDLVLTGFFRSCFPTKMFCYCFIYNRKYMKQNLTWKCKHVIRVVRRLYMAGVLNVLVSIFKWRFVKCILFINFSLIVTNPSIVIYTFGVNMIIWNFVNKFNYFFTIEIVDTL